MDDYRTERTSNEPVPVAELQEWLKGLSDEDFRKLSFVAYLYLSVGRK